MGKGARGSPLPSIADTQRTEIQGAVDELSQLIGSPVTLETTTFQLIAHSRHIGKIDPARQLTILQRSVPAEIVRALYDAGVMRRLNGTKDPIRIPGVASVGLGERVAMPVRIHNAILGYIWVQETGRRLTEADSKALIRAARILGPYLRQARRSQLDRQKSISGLLWRLLSGETNDPFQIQSMARILDVRVPAPYRVAIISLSPPKESNPRDGQYYQVKLDELISTLTDFISAIDFELGMVSLWTTMEYELFLLIGPKRDGPARDPLSALSEIADFGRQEVRSRGFRFALGVSQLAESLDKAKEHCQEALRCARIGGLLQGTYANFAVADVLGPLQLFLPQLRELPAMSCVGVQHHVRKLRQAEHRSVLGFPALETLEKYLDAGGDVRRAASSLGIHTNTLNYRLRRIIAVTGLDFSDGIQRLAVHVELKLLRCSTS